MAAGLAWIVTELMGERPAEICGGIKIESSSLRVIFADAANPPIPASHFAGTSLAGAGSPFHRRRRNIMTDELSAGFTGTPAERPTGVHKMAKDAQDAVVRESTAVVAGAAEHPHTATGIVLTIGALAFAIGYVVGRDASLNNSRWW